MWLRSLTPLVRLRSFSLQPGGAAGQRPADWLLPPLPRLLRSDHLAAGHQGHGGPGVGFHLPLLPLQVPVEAHGEGHDQHLQVRNKMESDSVFQRGGWYFFPCCSTNLLLSGRWTLHITYGWKWIPLFILQFIQHTVGTQERAHPQVCSRELLFPDEKGELFACEQMSKTVIQRLYQLFSTIKWHPVVSRRFQILMPCWVTSSQICGSTPTRQRERVSCCSKCAKESETCFTPALQMWVSFPGSVRAKHWCLI